MKEDTGIRLTISRKEHDELMEKHPELFKELNEDGGNASWSLYGKTYHSISLELKSRIKTALRWQVFK